MRRYLLAFLVFVAPLWTHGQYFQFSQYNFSGQRINPGQVASSDYASVDLLFRNQSTDASEVRLKSSLLSAVYPFINARTGKRWSGVGISLMDDRSGGIFSVQEASLSYAVNVFLSRFQFLSLGFKGLYQKSGVDLGGLYTGSQYIPDRGFDASMSSGESIGLLRSDLITFSTGLYWQQDDNQGRKVAYWGVSFFDFNKPEDSFLGSDHRMNSTWVASGGIRLYHEQNLFVTPDLLVTHSSSRTVLNVGATTSYEVRPLPNRVAARIDVITRYVPGRSGILGLQLHRDQFAIGFSYDFPVMKRNPANTGAFEVALRIKQLVEPEYKQKQARRQSALEQRSVRKTAPGPNAAQINALENQPVTRDTLQSPVERKPRDVKASLIQKADSVIAQAKAGPISHEPFLIEKLNLHFNFEFNSTALDEHSMKYLSDLSEALKENDHMKVRLTGHTDNVGSAAFNMRLSKYRAEVIRDYLVGAGVNPKRIETDGKGLTEPINGNKTEADRALNRRVELVIYYQE